MRSGGEKIEAKCYVATVRPILQARAHQETNENGKAMFLNFVRLGSEVLHVEQQEFASQVLQLSKDLSDSIEAARCLRLPAARPVGDPTHSRARFGIQLPRKRHNQAPQELTATSEKHNQRQIQDGFEAFCYHAFTIDVLGVLLTHFSPQRERVLAETAAVQYLKTGKIVVAAPR